MSGKVDAIYRELNGHDLVVMTLWREGSQQ